MTNSNRPYLRSCLLLSMAIVSILVSTVVFVYECQQPETRVRDIDSHASVPHKTCVSGYYGENCSQLESPVNAFQCYGIDSSDPSVCSGNGECTAQDVCVCDYDYYGEECDLVQCPPKAQYVQFVDTTIIEVTRQIDSSSSWTQYSIPSISMDYTRGKAMYSHEAQLWVAVGQEPGTLLAGIIYSSDGRNWNGANFDGDPRPTTGIYGADYNPYENKWVAASNDASYTSSDGGVTWTVHSQSVDLRYVQHLNSTQEWVSYQNVGGGSAQTYIYTSLDGITWTQGYLIDGWPVDDLSCSDTRCVAISGQGVYHYSDNASDAWTYSVSGQHYSIAYGKIQGLWVTVSIDGGSSSIQYSSSGSSWSTSSYSLPSISGANAYQVTYSYPNSQWIIYVEGANPESFDVHVSQDGENWQNVGSRINQVLIGGQNDLYCSGHGTCTGLDTCDCDSGWYGDGCAFDYQCYGISPDDSQVCSTHGDCVAQDDCQCDVQWDTDAQCSDPIECFGIPFNDSQVCSSNGECTSPDTCQCDSGFYGEECQFDYTCSGVAPDDPQVCSSHGNCTAQDDCQCNAGYTGLDCQLSICYGRNESDPQVCSAHGSCTAPDQCQCDAGYTGQECELSVCFGRNETDPQVCSSHGTCTGPDTCQCQSDYTGQECQLSICYGKNESDPQVCSAHGTCTAPDTCHCDAQYYGQQCDQWDCGVYSKDNVAKVCSAHGTCVAPNQCACQQGYFNGSAIEPVIHSVKDPMSFTLSKPTAMQFSNASQRLNIMYQAGPQVGGFATWDLRTPYSNIRPISADTNAYWPYRSDQVGDDLMFYSGNDGRVGVYQVNGDQPSQFLDNSICDGQLFDLACVESKVDDQEIHCYASKVIDTSVLHVKYNATTQQFDDGFCDDIETGSSTGGVIFTDNYFYVTHYTNNDLVQFELDPQTGLVNASSQNTVLLSLPLIDPVYMHRNNGTLWIGSYSDSTLMIVDEDDPSNILVNLYDTGLGNIRSFYSIGDGHVLVGGLGSSLIWLHLNPVDYSVDVIQHFSFPSQDYTFESLVRYPTELDNHLIMISGVSFSSDSWLVAQPLEGYCYKEPATCFGVSGFSDQVCSNHGLCVGEDTCDCDSGWYDTECQFDYTCFGQVPSNSSVCNGHGQCVAQDDCVCQQNYTGLECELTICYGRNESDPQVCSNHGNCTAPDDCACDLGYTGETCQYPICYGLNSTDPQVCSQHGTCMTPDDCVCDLGYTGQECQLLVCYGRNETDPQVCSSHGTCINPDQCDCDQGYTGETCQLSICFGRNETDPQVCDGHGICTAPDQCQCDSGYTGEACQLSICDGLNSTDPQVCSTHGACVAPDTCQCDTGYVGEFCALVACYGKNETNPKVCDGHGQCVAPNNCSCDAGYTGLECQLSICYGRNSSDPQVCSQHGQCVAPDTCICEPQWNVTQNCSQPMECYDVPFNDVQVCSSHGACIAQDTCQCDLEWQGSNQCGQPSSNSTLYAVIFQDDDGTTLAEEERLFHL